MNNKEVSELLKNPSDIVKFEVYKGLFQIHLKDGRIFEIEPTLDGSGDLKLDYYCA